MPAHIEPKKEAGVAYKNKYIRAAIRERIPACSLPKLRAMIDRIYAGVQANECHEFRSFPKPSAPAVREWIRTYKRNGSMPYSVVDKRGVRKARRRINTKVNDVLDEILQKHYLKPRGETVRTTHRLLEREIRAINKNEGQDLKCPSLSTLNRRVHELPKMLVDRHRYGSAYAKNKWRYSMHGDQSTRIMERVEVAGSPFVTPSASPTNRPSLHRAQAALNAANELAAQLHEQNFAQMYIGSSKKAFELIASCLTHDFSVADRGFAQSLLATLIKQYKTQRWSSAKPQLSQFDLFCGCST